MIEQLKRLSELAPDVCERVAPTIFKIRVRASNDIYARNIYPAETTGSSAIEDEAWLVYALKRAIEARGWMWTTWEDLGKGAKVFTYKTGYNVDDYETEAAALLAVLIKALERE